LGYAGGHNVAGKAVCEGGLMLDLSPMKGVRVDPARRTARAQPGLTLGDFDRETQAFGLATPLGVVSMTGIAGSPLWAVSADSTASMVSPATTSSLQT
jgi:FAD/FMN-containing dehydrogenase